MKRKYVLALVVILIVILISSFFIVKNMTGSEVKEDTESNSFSFYSEEYCRCFEREYRKCYYEGFEYDSKRNLCVKDNEVTNSILSCSAYECLGKIYRFNLDTKIWEEEV